MISPTQTSGCFSTCHLCGSFRHHTGEELRPSAVATRHSRACNQEHTGRCKRCSALPSTEPYPPPASPTSLALPPWSATVGITSPIRIPVREYINPIPFQEVAPSQQTESAHLLGVNPFLRTDSPMSNCCSHGTFLHLSLQSSHLNICYYHQDLHQRQFNPGSHLRLQHYRCTLLHIGPSSSARWPGVSATLDRHPFSGLVDSAGELLHTP